MFTRVESRLKTWSLQDKSPPFSGDYQRRLTSGHSVCRHTDVASLTTASQLVWRALDSPLFDKAIAGAKTAAAAYASKAVANAVSKIPQLMGRRRNGKSRAIEVVQKFGQAGAGKGPVVLQSLPQARKIRAAVRVGGRRSAAPRRSGAKSRTVSAPVARARVTTTGAPQVGGRGPVVVRHSEYLGEISGSVGYANKAYSINPGLPQSFPWLANIAIQYEEYRVKKLVYRYETEASSSTKGTVVLVTDVDALDSAFGSKQQALDYRGAVRTAPWTRVSHNAQTAARSPYGARFVRSGAVPAGGDAKTYDTGVFQVITQGMADTAIVGELHVDYIFEFIGPKVNNVLGANLLGLDLRSGGTTTPAAPLGSAPTQVAGSNIFAAVNGGNSVTFDFTGRLMMSLVVQGTGLTAASIAPSGGASVAIIWGVAISTTACIYTVAIDLIANVGQGVGINVTGTTVTNCYLVCQQMSSGLLLSKKAEPKGIPMWSPPDPLLEKIARLESILRRARLIEDEPPAVPTSAMFPTAQTGMTGY